ncbi:alpha-2-macroglobulin family protein [Coprobacter tertius]|uniref:MG2 domain-containing protein n=1 Tax=Coprobacter tertius TaxID=2944915 RepID=A0ABT1MMI0_9BACT|nr:alpha-2-macroglobulin family protein [Coprobacter tertius]MCP9613121.1 MG2 domain-containing protein [Coprobacter tertius]
MNKMVKSVLFAFMLSLSVLPVFAQIEGIPHGVKISDAEIENFKNPALALAKSEEALQAAIKGNDGPMIIKSLADYTTYQLLISQDSFPAIIKRTEEIILHTGDKAGKAVLNSFLASLYQGYYLQDAYRYNRRDMLADTRPEDIAEWSGKMFLLKCDTLLRQSLQPAGDLQHIPANQYRAALIEGKSSPTLRPTLFDFLAFRAISIYKTLSGYARSVFPDAEPVNEERALAPAKEFIGYDFNFSGSDDEKAVLGIYQQLLAFHSKDNNAEAFLMTDLDRLAYANRQYTHDSLYTQRLRELMREYRDNEYVTEVARQLLNIYRSNRDEENLGNFLQECKGIVKQYPGFDGSICLAGLIKEITFPSLVASISETVGIDEEPACEVGYRNIGSFEIFLYSITQAGAEDTIYRNTVTAAHRFNYFDKQDTVKLPSLPVGTYRLKILPDRIDSLAVWVTFKVSRLMALNRASGPGMSQWIVVDRMTGKPISNAEVIIYDDAEKEIEKLKVGKDGTLRHKITEEGNWYRVVMKNDSTRMGYINDYYGPSTKKHSQNNIWLFSDRSVYRPGQTVYFSGIYGEIGENENRIIANEKVEIELLDRGEVLSSTSLVTDEFGSFSGSFNLPAHASPGSYSIRVVKPLYKSLYIQVAEYKRPSFRITLDKGKQAYAFGKIVDISGNAMRFSGVSVAGATVSYRIERLRSWFRWGNAPQKQVAEGTTVTDENGNFSFRFVPQKPEEDLLNTNVSYNYQVTVNVTSATGETQEQKIVLSVGDTSLRVNVTLPDKADKSKPVSFDISIRRSTPDSTALSCKYILYSLYDTDKPGIKNNISDYKIHMQREEYSFLSTKIPERADWSKLPSGPYRLVVQVTAPNGNVVSEESNIVLYSLSDKKPPVVTPLWVPESTVKVIKGETASVVFGSSCKNAWIRYDLYEGTTLIDSKWIKVSNRNKQIKIPYKTSYGDILTVQLLLAKEGRAYQQSVFIVPEKPDRKLQIVTSTFRDKLTPGEKETWSFTVKDEKGNPVSARFMAEMYDASLNSILSHKWYFQPVYPIYRPYIFWNWIWPNHSVSRSPEFNSGPICKPFDFDKLNFLYGLSVDERYGFNQPQPFLSVQESSAPLSEVVVRGVSANGVMKKERSEDVLVGGMAQDREAEDAVAGQEPVYRQDFNETAFFYPKLQTDESGEVSLTFTVPESNTEWQFMALAFTKDLFYGQKDLKAVSRKKLMVAPNVPRFVRQGDEVSIATLISNTGDIVQEGVVIFDLFDPYTGKVANTVSQAFILDPGKSRTAVYKFTAPEDVDLVGFRVRAVSPNTSDGEQHLLPVLPVRALVTEAMQINMNGDKNVETFEMKSLQMKSSSGAKNYRLTLEYSSNPTWYAVLALPSLIENTGTNATDVLAAYYANTVAEGIARQNKKVMAAIKSWESDKGNVKTLRSDLEKNQELKNVLLSETPWVMAATSETERMQSLSSLLNINRAQGLKKEALEKLRKLQTAAGGWSWFRNMNPSPFITYNVLGAMAQLTHLGMAEYGNAEKMMQMRAIAYIDSNMVESVKKGNATVNYDRILYLNVRSAYRDIPLAGSILPVHKKLIADFRANWWKSSLYEKALGAVALYRYGFTDDAKAILKSLSQYATVTPDGGMFWQNNRSSVYSRNSAIQEHTAIMDAFAEIAPDTVRLNQMKQWLLQQKKTQNWGSVPSTVDAIYVLLNTGSDWLGGSDDAQIRWGGELMPRNTAEALTGYVQYTRQGKEITPELADVEIENNNRQPSSGALYRQYFDDFKNINKSSSGGLSIERQLYVEKVSASGVEYVPLNTTQLKVGDKINVRLVIKVNQDLQFVSLKDQRAACFEPVDQLSSYRYSDRIPYFLETRDASTTFYFDYLPKGTYVFDYYVRADRPGTYTNGIATIQCLYAPQFVSNTAGGAIIVE